MLVLAAAGVQPCPGSHCSKQSVVDTVNKICKMNGWPAGRHVVIDDPTGGKCYCTCSCLAENSPVEMSPADFQPVQSFAIGSPVMASDLSFNWTQKTVSDVVFTDQIGSQNVVFLVYGGTGLTVTSDHLFLVEGKYLITADKLTIDDKLTAADGSAVAIKEVRQGDFFGAFFNLSTDSASDPKTDPNNHLINTNAVISGDYALQTFYQAGMLDPALLHAELHSRPAVGSLEYHEKYPYAEPSPAAMQAAGAMGISISTNGELAPGQFIDRREQNDMTGEMVEFEALGFIPVHEPGVLEQLPHYKFSDANRKEMGAHLCRTYSGFYPDIDFEVIWYVRNVNVFSIPAAGDQRARVIISGGALRNKMLDYSSIALAISYAVANISADDPEDMRNVGFSDYYGAAAVMRNVWWELDYFTRMEEAIPELESLFSYIPLNFGIEGNPAYPSSLCRIESYQNATAASGIPDCAKLS